MRPGLAIAVAASALATGCIHGPHIDLNSPVCLVVKQKPTDRAKELKFYDAMINGTALWSKHFRHPVFSVIITDNENYCNNPPIYVRAKNLPPDVGGFAQAHLDHHSIDISPDYLHPVIFAHELGHVLWAYQHIDGRLSVMNSSSPFYPTPKDLEMLCDVHREIECPKFVWCEDTFYDVFRCPSASPEEGEEKLKWRKK